MVAHVETVAFIGVEARPVDVQVQISGGLPAFTVVGLPDKAVGESRERVRAALAAIGLGLQQWIAGLGLFVAGHTLAVFAARRDPDFLPVLARHLRQAQALVGEAVDGGLGVDVVVHCVGI